MTVTALTDRVVVSVTATDSQDWEVTNTPASFVGITAANFSDNDYVEGFVLFENGTDFEAYGSDDGTTTNLLRIANVAGTSVIGRPATPYASSAAGGARVDAGTGTHQLFLTPGAAASKRNQRASNPSIKTFSSGDSTPSIGDYRLLKTSGTTAITSFDDMPKGHIFFVQRGDSDISITNGSSIVLGGYDLELTVDNPFAIFQEDGGVAKLISPRVPRYVANSTTPAASAIASGAATLSQWAHTLSAETSTADDLDTVSFTGEMPVGAAITVGAAAGHTITIKHGTGNISTETGRDITLTGIKRATFYRTSTGVDAVDAISPQALSSTANGKGASLVGVEDSANNFTATNLEDILAELKNNTGFRFTNKAALEAFSGYAVFADGAPVELSGRASSRDGGGGSFEWRTGDQSANITGDPSGGMWIAPSGASTGASGAYQRVDTDRLNARWFGAAGDGTTEDQGAFNAAITWAAANELRSVRVPAGTYILNATVVLKSGVYLVGDSAGETIIKRKSLNTAPFDMFTDDQNVRNIGVRDITFDGNRAGQASDSEASQIIALDDSDSTALEFSAERCRFINFSFGGHAVHPKGYQSISIKTCFFEDGGGNNLYHGIYCRRTGRVRIEGCDFDNCRAACIKVQPINVGDLVTITNNTGRNCQRGVLVQDAANFAVTGNAFNTCSVYGISVTQEIDATEVGGAITGNSIVSANIGIYVQDAQSVAITGNSLVETPEVGIDLRDAAGSSVVGNTIKNTAAVGSTGFRGVRVQDGPGSTDAVSIHGNTIWSTLTGGTRYGIQIEETGASTISIRNNELVGNFNSNGEYVIASAAALAHLIPGYGPELTISGGEVTPTHTYHRIDTEGNAATDTLNAIRTAGSRPGDVLIVNQANDSRDLTYTAASATSDGDLFLPGNRNLTSSSAKDILTFIHRDDDWLCTSYSDNQ